MLREARKLPTITQIRTAETKNDDAAEDESSHTLCTPRESEEKEKKETLKGRHPRKVGYYAKKSEINGEPLLRILLATWRILDKMRTDTQDVINRRTCVPQKASPSKAEKIQLQQHDKTGGQNHIRLLCV